MLKESFNTISELENVEISHFHVEGTTKKYLRAICDS